MDLQGCIFSVFSLLPSLHSDQSSFFLPSALLNGALSILQKKGCPIFMLTSGNLEPNAGLGLVEGQRGHTRHTECLTQIWPRVQIRDELQQGRNPYTSTSQREHPKVTMVGGKHCWGILGHLPHLQWPACSLQHQRGSKPPGMPCPHTHTHTQELQISESSHPHRLPLIGLSGVEAPALSSTACIHQVAFSIRQEVSCLSALPPTRKALS